MTARQAVIAQGDAARSVNRCGIYDGVYLRCASQDEVCEFFFRAESSERIASVSILVSSARSLLAVAPPLTASRKAGSLSLGMRTVWLRPLAQYWRLW